MSSYLGPSIGISGLLGENGREELEEGQLAESELGKGLLVFVDKKFAREKVSLLKFFQSQGLQSNTNQPGRYIEC